MAPNNPLVVGRIVGAFGIKGWVKVKSFTQPAENILSYEPLWLVSTYEGAPQQRCKAHIEVSSFRPQGLVVQLKGVADRTAAERLRGAHLEIDRQMLPSLGRDDYYWHELVGLEVVSQYQGKETHLGCVKSLLETGANDVLVVEDKTPGVDISERLVPYLLGVYVLDVDLEQKRMTVNWDPEF